MGALGEKTFDVRQRFSQDGRFLGRGKVWDGHGFIPQEDAAILLGERHKYSDTSSFVSAALAFCLRRKCATTVPEHYVLSMCFPDEQKSWLGELRQVLFRCIASTKIRFYP